VLDFMFASSVCGLGAEAPLQSNHRAGILGGNG